MAVRLPDKCVRNSGGGGGWNDGGVKEDGDERKGEHLSDQGDARIG